MQKCIKFLEDPNKVAAIQKFFGVSYNKKVSPKLSSDSERQNEENTTMLRKISTTVNTAEISNKVDRDELGTHETLSSETYNNIESGNTSNRNNETCKNYTVKNKFWYFLFYFGTYLGDVVGYAVVIPFWFWNIDGVICRKFVLVWTVVMYIGQVLKEIVCRERPACPPAIRLQKKWSEEYGMPSTHAMVGVAFPSCIIYYSARRYKFSYYYGIIAAIIWCTLISFSRLYLGMHSILDVFVGFLLSSLLLVPFLPLMDIIGNAIVQYSWLPVVMIVLSIILVIIYPKPQGPLITSTRGDTTTILATCAGIQIGCWLNYQLHIVQQSTQMPPYDIKLPEWWSVGTGIVRTILGLVCIVFSLLLFELMVKATNWILIRSKISTKEDVNNTKGGIVISDVFFKYLTFFVTSFHVVYSIPALFKYLNISRSSYYFE
ncbi:hypothetical protein PGB90_002842 [Kerria lacca]